MLLRRSSPTADVWPRRHTRARVPWCAVEGLRREQPPWGRRQQDTSASRPNWLRLAEEHVGSSRRSSHAFLPAAFVFGSHPPRTDSSLWAPARARESSARLSL